MGFRERIAKFMYGRYGTDQLSKLLLGVAMGFLFVYLFTHFLPAYVVGLGLCIYSLYRSLSRDTARMAALNQRYLNWRYKLLVRRDGAKKRFAQRREYCFFRCPSCRQRVRVPRGRGRIAITCPKCATEFIKKS